MGNIVDILHAGTSLIVGGLLSAVAPMGTDAGLIIVSALAGVVLVLLYGRVSRQAAIRDAKRGIHGALLESVLFKHDVRLSLRAQKRMVTYGFRYFTLALPPLVILAVPCVLVMAQLARWYEWRPLKPGESAVLRVAVHDGSSILSASLSSGDKLDATLPVRVEQSREVFWRITPRHPGVEIAAIRVASGEYRQPVVAALDGPLLAGTYRDWWDRLLYPATGAVSELPEAVQSVEVRYPSRSLSLLGFNMHWAVVFFVVSLISGLIAAKLFRVEV